MTLKQPTGGCHANAIARSARRREGFSLRRCQPLDRAHCEHLICSGQQPLHQVKGVRFRSDQHATLVLANRVEDHARGPSPAW